MSSQNGNSGAVSGVYRETPAETEKRLALAQQQLAQIVDGTGTPVGNGNGMPGPSLVRVNEPMPVDAPPVVLPVQFTAAVLAIQAKGQAVLLSARQEIERRRTTLRERRAHEVAELATCRSRRAQAQTEFNEAAAERDEFAKGVPVWRRRMLGRRTGRAVRMVPWALWAADTMIISRAWGLFGGVPVPFVHSSTSVSSLTSLLRAGLVSFGLIFGMRMVGSRLREAADRVRLGDERIGIASDVTVVGVVLFFAVQLATSTSQMQAALMKVVGGSTSVQVPTSALFAIVAFLMAFSLASGYFLTETEIEQAQVHEERVADLRDALNTAIAFENTTVGEVRSVREQLRGLDREEQLLIAEQEAHIDEEVYVHKKANVHIYGLDLAEELDRDAGISESVTRDDV